MADLTLTQCRFYTILLKRVSVSKNESVCYIVGNAILLKRVSVSKNESVCYIVGNAIFTLQK